MNRKLRSLLALVLLACLGLGTLAPGLAASLDYSVAEKLEKQLEAGSGFTGTLSLSLTAAQDREAEAITTASPIVLDLAYIYAREDVAAGLPAERRLSLLYPDTSNPQASLYLSFKEGGAFLKSNLLGPDWLALHSPGEAQTGAAPAVPGALAQAVEGLLGQTAVPSLLSFLASLGFQGQFSGEDALAEALVPFTTKIDLWIEGYRQSAVLGKLEDGTTTMEVKYAITPAAIKAQLKQMVLDLLSDPVLLPQLQALLPREQARRFLEPKLQSHYFAAIDALPLGEEMTISRTVSLKGDTLALHLRLPFYDAQGGALALNYDRTAGEGDLPDSNVLSLESQVLSLRLEYQVYHSLTGVTVYQGTLRREPRGLVGFQVGEAQDQALGKTLSAAFTLTHTQAGNLDREGVETLTHSLELSLSPLLTTQNEQGEEISLTQAELATYYQFPALEITASAAFASKPAKNASTSLEATLKVSSEDLPQVLELSLSGKTVAKWPLDSFDAQGLQVLPALSQEALEKLLTQAAGQAALLFLPHFRLPQAQVMGGGQGISPVEAALAPKVDTDPKAIP